MNSLTITLEPRGQELRVWFAGEITENSDFEPVLQSGSPRLALDLAGVKRINSCGVREWINFVNTLQKSGRTFVLERCSVPVVNQLNMISNFHGTGEVRSIYAPYFCAECNAEHVRLIELDGSDVSGRLAEPFACPTCARPMEFDDLPEAYISFLA